MQRTSLAVWGSGPLRRLRQRQADGAAVVAWPGAEPSVLVQAGIPFRTLEEVIGAAAIAAAESAARGWARVWARLPLSEGRSFRELAQWRDESLLWSVEVFLRSSTVGPCCARSAELALRLLETVQPSEVDAFGLGSRDTILLARASTACGVLFHGASGSAKASPPKGRRPGVTGVLRRLVRRLSLGSAPHLPAAGGGPAQARALLVILARPDDRAAIGSWLEAVATELEMRPVVVELGALHAFETRRARRAARRAARQLRECLGRLRGTPAAAASYAHRGVGFADLAAGDLELLLGERLPQAVRRLECAVELMEAARPALLLLAADDRDECRTLGMAAAAAGVPWAVLRAGASALEEPARADGGPHPAASVPLGPGSPGAAVLAQLRAAAYGTVCPP